jgi:antitoxin component HigA of HigAB toxin-antitoxin module
MEQPESVTINDEIELFTTLISIYEDKNFPIDPPDPIDAI